MEAKVDGRDTGKGFKERDDKKVDKPCLDLWDLCGGALHKGRDGEAEGGFLCSLLEELFHDAVGPVFTESDGLCRV